MKNELQSVGFSLLDRGESTALAFDNTKLYNINICPTWGLVRYGMHKRMPRVNENARSMALEAGSACHEVFAAIRVAQLFSVHPDHARAAGQRIFGASRFESLSAVISRADNTDAAIRAAALEALATSGFTDDPWDKRRTLSNLEASVLAYASSYDADRFPVWIADKRDPKGLVGIELPFEVLVTFLTIDGSSHEYRFTGKIDALHTNGDSDEVLLHENKTASRLDDGWRQSFEIAHQVTGYCIAASLFTHSNVRRAVVRGVSLPLPKMVLNGLIDVWTTREAHHKEAWTAWLWHTIQLYHQYKDTPLDAPKYSHSCNRYFRPCPMIPFCAGDRQEQEQILTEMVTDEWNPLAEEYDG